MPDPTPLDRDDIARQACAFDIEVHALLDSTQVRARERVQSGARGAAAVIADAQSGGRGQRGRQWQSPAGAAIYMTVVWPSRRGVAGLTGLSLVVGLAVRATLARWHVDAQLKWPNDVWVDQRKLAGILIEVVADRQDCCALIGIGLNLDLPAAAAAAIDQPWIDLAQLLQPLPSRNVLTAALLTHLAEYLTRFEQAGFGCFREEWNQADALSGHAVWLLEANGPVAARALGIDEAGRLLIEIGGRQHTLSAGEISIRLRTLGTA